MQTLYMQTLHAQCIAEVDRHAPVKKVQEEIIDADELEAQRRQILAYCGAPQAVLSIRKPVQHYHKSWGGMIVAYADDAFMIIGLNKTGQAIVLVDSKGKKFETDSHVVRGLLDMNGKIDYPPPVQEQWEP